jgi:5'-3' exonuclease
MHPLLTVSCAAAAAAGVCLRVCVCRYYHEKMQAPPGQQEGIIRQIVGAYVEGLCWVMRYYYEGVASWEW